MACTNTPIAHDPKIYGAPFSPGPAIGLCKQTNSTGPKNIWGPILTHNDTNIKYVVKLCCDGWQCRDKASISAVGQQIKTPYKLFHFYFGSIISFYLSFLDFSSFNQIFSCYLFPLLSFQSSYFI